MAYYSAGKKNLYIEQISLQLNQTKRFLNLCLLLQIKYNVNQCFFILPLDWITIETFLDMESARAVKYV